MIRTEDKVLRLLSLSAPLFLLFFLFATAAAAPQDALPFVDAQSTTSSPVPPDGLFRGHELGAGRNQFVISGVPAYIWRRGCGPTAAGMVIGYWDGRGPGFGNLIEGDASTQTQQVNEAISSDGNYDDYCRPLDYWPGPILEDLSEMPPGDEHDDNCIADFMKTSQSYVDNYYGWSWLSHVDNALKKWVHHVDPDHLSIHVDTMYWWKLSWTEYCDEIDALRPVILLVDSDGDGGTDHFVTAVGYDEQGGQRYYGCHDTYDKNVHWYEFEGMSYGQPYGIHSAVMTDIATEKTTYFVPDDHATIQNAIDAADNGDVVVVRPGTYVENIDFKGKAIAVRSQHGPEVTIIDGGQPVDPDHASVVSFMNDEGLDSCLRGFTLMNGTGTGDDPGERDGGGIYCEESSPKLIRNIVRNNTASRWGGGISCEDASPWIVACTIVDNTAAGAGGGILCADESDAFISNNRIHRNTAETGRGGGIGCSDSAAVVTCNTVYDNYAKTAGGGISCTESAAPSITNTIVWDNRNDSGPDEIDADSTSSPVVTFCDVKGGHAGAGNIDADPLFADPVAGDFHLLWNSPCWNAGDSAASMANSDFEGDPRMWFGAPDIGADEWCYHLYTDGAVIPGAPVNLKVIGYPTAGVVLFLGSGTLSPPFQTQYGKVWLKAPILWKEYLGIVPADGLLIFSAVVPASWSTSTEHPFQALVGPLGGSWTRLTNLEKILVE